MYNLWENQDWFVDEAGSSMNRRIFHSLMGQMLKIVPTSHHPAESKCEGLQYRKANKHSSSLIQKTNNWP